MDQEQTVLCRVLRLLPLPLKQKLNVDPTRTVVMGDFLRHPRRLKRCIKVVHSLRFWPSASPCGHRLVLCSRQPVFFCTT